MIPNDLTKSQPSLLSAVALAAKSLSECKDLCAQTYKPGMYHSFCIHLVGNICVRIQRNHLTLDFIRSYSDILVRLGPLVQKIYTKGVNEHLFTLYNLGCELKETLTKLSTKLKEKSMSYDELVVYKQGFAAVNIVATAYRVQQCLDKCPRVQEYVQHFEHHVHVIDGFLVCGNYDLW